MAATTPDCSIDYTRWYSLPFGVPPVGISATDLDAYLSALGARTDEYYCRLDGGLAFDPLVWDATAGPPDRVPFSVINSDGKGLIVPLSTRIPGATNDSLTVAAFEAAIAPWSTPATLNGGDSGTALVQKTMAVLSWSKEDRAGGQLPMPIVPDDTIPIWWAAPGPDEGAVPPQGVAIDGVLKSDGTVNNATPATHLLSSGASSWSGEYTRTLIRAPGFGQVRFQRYRHVERSGGTLILRNPSAAGRLVLQVPPRSVGIPDASVAHPIDATTIVVLEHVNLDSAVKYLGALLTYQVTRFDDFITADLVKRGDSIPVVRRLFTELIRTWIATAPGLAPPIGVSDAAYKPFIPPAAGVPPVRTIDQIKAVIAVLKADGSRLDAFIDFIRTLYVPALCGVAITNQALAPVARSANASLLCYGGCPIGEPAAMYAPAGADVANPNDALINALTTFDVEAMHILGTAQGALGIANITQPAPDNLFDPISLVDFSPNMMGLMAMGRCAEPRSPTASYGRLTPVTFIEFLRAAAYGVTRLRYVPAALDLTSFATGANTHPLLAPLMWQTIQDAKTLRAATDLADAAKIGAKTVAQATIDWWSRRTGLLDAMKTWPLVAIGGGVSRTSPTPTRPFTQATSLAVTTDGYDVFDLQAIAQAQAAVRDGKTLGAVPLPLFLALLRTESFFQATIPHRTGSFTSTDKSRAAVAAGSVVERRFVRNEARGVWSVIPFGMDEINLNGPEPADPLLFATTVESQFDAVLKDLTTPVPSSIGGVADAPIIDANVLPTAQLRDYLEQVFETRFFGLGSVLQFRILSRRTQWIGMALQMALFQWKHRCMYLAKADPHAQAVAFSAVTEFQASESPPLGAGANSPERCAFVTYYASVDLGFNAGPVAWNQWMSAAQGEIARREGAGGPPGELASRMYMLFKNPAGQENSLLPPFGPGDQRILGQRGNSLRFATALDLYARVYDPAAPGGPPPDLVDPAARDAAGNSNWKLKGE